MASFNFKSPEHSGLEYLRNYHTFGRRADSVDTLIQQAFISKLHAIFEWREPCWYVQDVSKNGLKVNGKIIPAQRQLALKKGDLIDFAGMNEVTLTMVNLDAPQAMLINTEQPTETTALAESMLLPNESSPELALYLCSDREQWFAEKIANGVEVGPFEHNDTIEIEKSHWKFLLLVKDHRASELDAKQTTLDDVIFRFDLGQDKETTNLTLIENGMEIDLGERSHHYLLLHLIRHRLNDNFGWLDSQLLMRELDLKEAQMNIQFFRARKQVARALPNAVGHSKLIERRRGALRVNISNIEIYKEGVIER